MQNTEELKNALLAEKKKLEAELGHLGVHAAGDWVATEADIKEEGVAGPEREADPQDAATDIEQFEERSAVEANLEKRLSEVNEALKRMGQGSYGTCTIGGDSHDIAAERLQANPAALTCIEHAH